MKPHVHIILLFLLLPFANLAAQFNTFDLSKYKTADYERRILTFSGNISGSYAEDKSKAEKSSLDIYQKHFNSNLNLNYDYIKNTRKIQQDFQLGFLLNPKTSSSYSLHSQGYYENDKSNNSTNTGELNFNSNNRFYSSEKNFFEVDVTGLLSAGYTHNGDNNSNYDYRRLSSNLVVPVKLGIGRLENIEDARLALFIIEDMQKNQQLNKEMTDEDIMLFASKITQLKNKRHFDQRKRRIYEIQSLDSFLRENAFTSAQNALFFSTLMDNWEYANNPRRQAGNRYSIGAAPQIAYSIVNNLSLQKTKNTIIGVDLFAEMYSAKPINLKWQRDIQLRGGYMKNGDKNNYDYNNNNYLDYDNKSKTDKVYVTGNLGYGFYPNTRSYFNLSLNSNIEKNWIAWSPTDNSNENMFWNYKVGLTLNGYYYFSERLSLNYNLTSGYQKRNTETRIDTTKYHNFATSFNVSFAYSIF